MTVGQARILAIIISLAYIPAYLFGLVSIWSVLIASSVAYLFKAHLQDTLATITALSSAENKARICLLRALRGLVECASIQSLAFIIGLSVQLLLDIDAVAPASSLLALVDNSIYGGLLATLNLSDAYPLISTNNRILLHAAIAGVLLLGAVSISSSRSITKVIEQTLYQSADELRTWIAKYLLYYTVYPALGYMLLPSALALAYFGYFDIIRTQCPCGNLALLGLVSIPPFLGMAAFYCLWLALIASGRAGEIYSDNNRTNQN